MSSGNIQRLTAQRNNALGSTLGPFAQWQPAYAERGIATFPVREDKRPAVRGYPNMDLCGSTDLVRKFADAQALGFMCGERSKITVLDVDISDERVLADAVSRHGRTPILVRTASGKWHLWYRHAGERRRIRPWTGLPIDLLGTGGYAIVPPSKSQRSSYEFVHGNLDDVDQLPRIREVATQPTRIEPEAREKVGQGHRNDNLFRHCLRHAPHCDDLNAMLDVAATFNESCNPPMSNDEVIRTAGSAWKAQVEGRNWTGRRLVVWEGSVADRLIREDPDVYVLQSFLRANNGPQSEFMATTKGLAVTLGWRPTRISAVRERLLSQRVIVQTRRARSNRPALYRWVRPYNEVEGGYPE